MQAPTVPRVDPKEQLNASGCGVTELAAKKATAMGEHDVGSWPAVISCTVGRVIISPAAALQVDILRYALRDFTPS
ncbi:hypothetical protein RIB2604_01801940 [Aspergillus luchuensis]|uniref:Uncharacterized protein n=1 Tax=Aspergillus kawachii TaxID=1069201 RepID=A0A146FES6_ASPKA|nr:hypothetical protein RIB2604_01801940 [Aspergillus luchuensis]